MNILICMMSGCICHLADLTIKAGMMTLPIDVDQLFLMSSTFFCTAAKESSNLLTTGIHSFKSLALCQSLY